MKKVLLFVMVLSMIAMTVSCTSTVAPTSAPTEAPTTAAASADTTESAEATAVAPATKAPLVTLTCWNPTKLTSGRTEINQMDTKIGKLIAEQTGVAFNVTFITADADTAFNLKLASNSWEDIIQCGKNNTWVEKLISGGVIEPVDSYLSQPEKYPNLAALSDKVKKNFTYTDGNIYYFPSFWYEKEDSVYGYWCANGWYVHPDYLKAVNMTADDLKTIAGVEKFLQAVAGAKLKTAEGQSVIPMTSSADLGYRNTIFTTFGVSTANNGWDMVNNQLVNTRQSPNTKLAYAWMNKLYRMGVMDPELTTQTNDMLVEKLTNKRIALIADAAWPFWSTVTGGKSPVTDLIYVAFPKVDGVDKVGIAQTYDPYGNSGWLLTKTCKDKDAVARAADWGEAKGEYMGWVAAYGPRGTEWDWGSKGEPTFKLIDPDLSNAQKTGDYKKMEDIGYTTTAMVWPFDLDLNYYNDDTQDTLFWIFGMHKFNAAQGYTTKVRPIDQVVISGDGAWGTNSATIADIDKQYAAKLVTAKDDAAFSAVWDEYQDKLTTMGKFADVQNEFQDAYTAQVK